MNPKFNTPTTRTETPSTLVNIKKLATRTALGLAMVTGGVTFNPEMANTANTANLQQPRQSTQIAEPKQPRQIASAEIQNKEAIDEVYNRAKQLSDAIGVPIRLVVTNQSAYFQMRDHYIQPDNTKNNIESCYGTSQQVSLSSYKSEKTGLVKEGFSGDKCALQLPVQFFGQAGDPIENFKSQLPELSQQIKSTITDYEFSDTQYYQLVNKLADLVDGSKDKNRKRIRIYVSPLMAFHVESKIKSNIQSLNLPALRGNSVEVTSEVPIREMLKESPREKYIRIKGDSNNILINLPVMLNSTSK